MVDEPLVVILFKRIKMNELTVIVPAHNEARCLEKNMLNLVSHLNKLRVPYNVIIVEDGSNDGTHDVASKISSKIPQVKTIHIQNRIGKGTAINNALKNVRHGHIVIMDADLAANFKCLPELIRTARDSGGVALGSRFIAGANTRRPLRRTIASRIFNLIVNLLFRTEIRDHQCGFKAFGKNILDKILPNMRNSYWIWDSEFIIRAQRAGYQTVEIPVVWREPRHESPLLRITPRMIIELFLTFFHLGPSFHARCEGIEPKAKRFPSYLIPQ